MSGKAVVLAKRLCSDNPGVTWENGGKHIKIMRRGRLLGILPFTLRKDGIDPNIRCQLRRAGLRVTI